LNIVPLSYRWHDQFTIREGKFVEYERNKSFAMEQLSITVKHTQSHCHISPVANGMINNEDRGIILIGVQDKGLIDGLMLSNAQQEHLVMNIIDTFDRFRPKVPRHFYDINFMRVKLTNSKANEGKSLPIR
jgi:predicted HTH transcriptional regulator